MGEEFLKAEIEELKELAADPTLEACCRRDLEDQLRTARLKAQLAPQDRSQARQRLAAQVLGAALAPGDEKDDLDSDSDELGEWGRRPWSDDGGSLISSPSCAEELRRLRLEEMQREMRIRSALQSEGHGGVSTVSAAKLDRTIAEAVAAYVVCHFGIEGDTQGDAIDQRLEGLAARFVGTRFLRCPMPPASPLPQRFGLPPGPGLVVLFQGTIVAVVGEYDLECGADEDAEDAVERWLQRRRCLVGDANAAAAPAPVSDDDDDGDEWNKPCDECGRRYPHQHVRSAYRGGDTAAHGDSDGD